MPTSRLVLSAPVGRPYARTLGHTVRLRPSSLLTRNRRMARATARTAATLPADAPRVSAARMDAEGGYSPVLHAATLSDAALASSIASAPASAIGSPLYVALINERSNRMASVILIDMAATNAAREEGPHTSAGHAGHFRPDTMPTCDRCRDIVVLDAAREV